MDSIALLPEEADLLHSTSRISDLVDQLSGKTLSNGRERQCVHNIFLQSDFHQKQLKSLGGLNCADVY